MQYRVFVPTCFDLCNDKCTRLNETHFPLWRVNAGVGIYPSENPLLFSVSSPICASHSFISSAHNVRRSFSSLRLVVQAPTTENVSLTELQRLASLSHIRLNAETDQTCTAVAQFIGWMSSLSQVPVDGLEPLVSPLQMLSGYATPLRPDQPLRGEPQVAANAPFVKDGFVIATKSVSDD